VANDVAAINATVAAIKVLRMYAMTGPFRVRCTNSRGSPVPKM
jgi:hypothetical protein